MTRTIARPRRALRWWICVASSSLPVPVSPSSSTVESVAATWLNLLDDAAHRRALADDAGQGLETGRVGGGLRALDAAIGIFAAECCQ